MAIKDYKFVSPGVQIKEIDQSVLEPTPLVIGPVVVGKFAKGPAFIPTIVNNVDEFRDVFGGTITGQEKVSDVWREGNFKLAPSYASIAAEAHLDAAVSPLTVVRVLGEQHDNKEAGGEAGWELDGSPNTVAENNASVYALVLNHLSGSNARDVPFPTGGGLNSSSYVAAYFYVTGTQIGLNGNQLTGTTGLVSGSGVWVRSQEHKSSVIDHVFKLEIGATETINFSLNPENSNYIRKVFNTNPTLTNPDVVGTSTEKNYWLGETFEKFIESKFSSIKTTDAVIAALVPLTNKAYENVIPHKFRFKAQPSKSGWVFSQHLGSTSSFANTESDYLSGVVANNKIISQTQKLFRFVSIGNGEFEQENYKILINNITPPKNLERYGTFDVTVLHINSLDSNLSVKEEFTGLNLDKSSPNYIAKRIGDKYFKWDYQEERLLEYNDFDNQSSVIRVEMFEDIVNGKSTEGLLPFGFFGPPRPGKIEVKPASSQVDDIYLYSGSIAGRHQTLVNVNDKSQIVFGYTGSAGNLTSSIVFPSFNLVSTIQKDKSNTNLNYFGINKGVNSTAQSPNDLFQNDLLRPLGKAEFYEASGTFEYSYVFTLDDVVAAGSSVTASWAYGNRYNNLSYTALNGNGALPVRENALASGLQINNFVLSLYGGFDGLNIKEAEPFKNANMSDSSTDKNSYVFNSLKVGISSVKDAEVVNMNCLVVPGVTNKNLTQYMLDTCQQRGDALAVIDLEGDYKPAVENTATHAASKPTNVKDVISKLKARNINSSYGAAYFPWVQVSVTKPQESPKDVWVPPSVVALGTFASSEAKSQLWFAPAGFNRGGLKELDTRQKYAAGFKVINTALQLTSKQRDDLYEVNINPIANFVNEGIVVFGQKTLQVIPSALDRINVRRLLIFLKKRVSIIASSILFDANVDVTWARFVNATDTFLKGVKAGLGLTDYKIVLDKTTTTDELIDRNILYAKIYIKPARAIEFIAVDFIITKSGASFTD